MHQGAIPVLINDAAAQGKEVIVGFRSSSKISGKLREAFSESDVKIFALEISDTQTIYFDAHSIEYIHLK